MTGPKLWPRALPAQVRSDRYRNAEVKVYDRLSAALSSSWTVFYSRPWLGLTSTGGERDGECDFIVAHPDRGVLAIEVKGGGISYDPATDGWLSEDRDGIRHHINNPIEQARKSKHELLKKLKLQRGWPNGKFVRLRHGVIFPDSPAPPSNLGADRPRELFCCRPDLAGIADWIDQRLSGDPSEVGPGNGGMQALEQLLAKPFRLRVPLSHVLEDDEQAIAALTPQQFYILDSVQDLPRVAVGGAAGTGKTIVAAEDAARLASEGVRTLLTCRGTPLAEHLRLRLASTTVEVMTFEELCVDLPRRAGLPLPTLRDEAFFETAAPELLLKAVRAAPLLRYGAVIVDEAQDFRSHWWLALEGILVEGASSRLHAYYDSNQKLYGAIGRTLAGFNLSPIRLSRNLRNTKAVHEAASKHYQGPSIIADGPPGVSVESHAVGAADIARTASEQIRRLVRTEGVAPADIAVLGLDPASLNHVTQQLERAGIIGVNVASIVDFKGLERPLVMVLATRSLADEPELAYVALSRARTHLVLVGEPEPLKWLADPSGRL